MRDSPALSTTDWTHQGSIRVIKLPVLTQLNVIDYGLFPGHPPGSGISWSLEPGLSLIAGINGLGKTTLLMMILRSLTGPYDLTGDGNPQSLPVVLPEKPVRLNSQSTTLFEQRVADGAEDAKVELSMNIGETGVKVSRRLKGLYLEELVVNGKPEVLPNSSDERESIFQSQLTKLTGLSSFVDVLLVLHHVILFHENRPGALWNPNVQRQLLRALCLDEKDASRITELERSLQSADSQARNIHARITATGKQRDKALRLESGEKGVHAELAAEQKLLDAELSEADRLQEKLQELDKDRKTARLAHQRAKVKREDASRATEHLKYSALLKHFPDMDVTTRLVMSRIMTEDRCLVCSTPAEAKRIELEKHLKNGSCPMCGAEPENQDNIVPPHEFDKARMERERNRAFKAAQEEETTSRKLGEIAAEYTETLDLLSNIRRSIEERKTRNNKLRAKLPQNSTSTDYENVLDTLRGEHRGWQEEIAVHLKDLRSLLADREQTITAKSTKLTETFATLIRALLVEKVRLVEVTAEPRYMQSPGQSEDRIRVPAYVAEMEAADRPGFIRRQDPSEVSESQRELIDLAFRLALVEVFGSSCTFVMETPEASLDGLAMERVGHALAEFSQKPENRLIATSNLSNTGIITALFGSTAPNGQEQTRMRRVLNLLKVAAPNGALLKNKERYNKLLANAVSGNTP